MPTLFQHFRLPPQFRKYLVTVAILLVILITFVLNRLVTPTATPTQVLVPSPSPSLFPASATQPYPTPKLSIKWQLTQEPTPPEKVTTYRLEASLTSPQIQSSLPELFGFSSSDQTTNSDKTVFYWIYKQRSLSINTKKNEILYSSGKVPTNTGNIFSDDLAISASRQIVSDLFGSEVGVSLTNANIAYYHTLNIYAVPSAQSEADLVRVSFSQSLGQYHTVALSETGSSFVLYLDRNLKLYSLSVTGGYLSLTQSADVPLLPFATAKQNLSSLQRLNAAPDLGTNFELASSKKINLSVVDFQIAYLQIGSNYLPVYLLSGPLTSDTAKEQSGLYALPATTSY